MVTSGNITQSKHYGAGWDGVMSAIGMPSPGHPALSPSALSAVPVWSPSALPKLVSYGPSELSKWRTVRVI